MFHFRCKPIRFRDFRFLFSVNRVLVFVFEKASKILNFNLSFFFFCFWQFSLSFSFFFLPAKHVCCISNVSADSFYCSLGVYSRICRQTSGKCSECKLFVYRPRKANAELRNPVLNKNDYIWPRLRYHRRRSPTIGTTRPSACLV